MRKGLILLLSCFLFASCSTMATKNANPAVDQTAVSPVVKVAKMKSKMKPSCRHVKKCSTNENGDKVCKKVKICKKVKKVKK